MFDMGVIVTTLGTGFEIPLAIAAIATSVGSGVVAFQGSRAQAKAANQSAKLAKQRAIAESDRRASLAKRQLGAARAQAGATGTSLDGSTIDILGDLAGEAALDISAIRIGGRGEAARFQAQAASAKSAGLGSLIGGLGSAAGTASGMGAFKNKMPNMGEKG